MIGSRFGGWTGAVLVALVAGACWTPSFRAGGTDGAGNFLGGTEVVVLSAHGGALFAGTSYANDTPGGDPSPGAQVIRLDAPGGGWERDSDFGPEVGRVASLREVTFTTDGSEAPLGSPVTLLLAGLETSTGGYEVASRSAAGAWTRRVVAPGGAAPFSVGALGVFDDAGTDRVFAGYGDATSGRAVVSGVYDASAPGGIAWDAVPEATDLDGRPLAFAEAEGALHLVAGANVYARSPGSSSWPLVHTDAATDGCTGSDCAGLRGLTSVADADGTGEDLLLAATAGTATIWRLDPENGYAATAELDVDAFLKARFGSDALAAAVAFNGFEPAVDPRTGETFHFVSLLFTPDAASTVDRSHAAFLVRGPEGDYELREVPYHDNPHGQSPEALIATRSFAPSPFPGEEGMFYAGGFYASSASHNTAWIDSSLTNLAAPTSTCLTGDPVVPPADYAVGIYDGPPLYDASRDRTIPYRVYYPQSFTGTAPVVIVSHGGTGAPNSHKNALAYLGQGLAGAGYVAVHPNHTSDISWYDRPVDIHFVLDWLESGALSIPGFGGVLDVENVGEAGHSWGSYTTLMVAGASTDLFGAWAVDPRPDAFLALSPQGEGQMGFVRGSWSGIWRPTYTMFGELEADGGGDVYAELWRRQPFDQMPVSHDKYASMLPDATHSDFNQGTGPVAEATQAFVVANGVAFFDTYLRGEDRFCELGNLAVPEGTVTDRK